MRRRPLAHAALILLATFLPPAGVFAQSAPGGTAGQPAAPSGKAAVPGDKAGRMMLQRVNRRIADLHAKLHITAAEEPQWHQFADVMRANASRMAQIFAVREKDFRSMNAVDDMKSYAGIAQQHAKNMELLVPAFENLYNSLSEEQKQTADRLWRGRAERAHRKHRG